MDNNDKFRTIYVYYGEHFIVYSNGNPLTYVMMWSKLNASGMHWVSELSN